MEPKWWSDVKFILGNACRDDLIANLEEGFATAAEGARREEREACAEAVEDRLLRMVAPADDYDEGVEAGLCEAADAIRARGQGQALRQRAEAAGELTTSMLASKEPSDG